jgi:four helix bundle protein
MSVIRGREVEPKARADVSSFEDLEVFQRAYRVSLDLRRILLQFLKIEQYVGLADQIRRASKSIYGNIAEGFGKQRQSSAEFKRHLRVAIRSADKMQVCWNTLIRKHANDGGTSTVRSRVCYRASIRIGELVLITDY